MNCVFGLPAQRDLELDFPGAETPVEMTGKAND
ncbi:hypothetical protein HG15A2_38600 [Adhaeretor mobilis]|uniref:Uncharacterized protein n=1 Tax=Adhaeretor mobilis TaxID=1930276 RepID=A0A517N057_9BACT|nr:hypothetical protein HG15A2_38600 [Adhaeretor mobilis]